MQCFKRHERHAISVSVLILSASGHRTGHETEIFTKKARSFLTAAGRGRGGRAAAPGEKEAKRAPDSGVRGGGGPV
ncbi:hypothetical protein HMPREF0262_01655 [Clostridium sp. ATCC 29733]|nr:hypothetical protein HMPREF0262_01655 [Clostridium sp. ATCC 29733]